MLQSLPREVHGFKGTGYGETEPEELYFIINILLHH